VHDCYSKSGDVPNVTVCHITLFGSGVLIGRVTVESVTEIITKYYELLSCLIVYGKFILV